MSWAIAGLMAGFIFMLMILALLLLKTRLPVLLKISAVFGVTIFYWIQYQSLQLYAGWPVADELPEEFVLLASNVIEPNKKTGEAGVMYWWVRESGDQRQPPRVYRLPYVSEVHEQSTSVLQQQGKGGQYVGRQSGNRYGDANLGISFEKISKSSRHQKAKKPGKAQ